MKKEHEHAVEYAEKKYKKKDKRKKSKMKVSGVGVKKLQKVISSKS